MAEPCGTGKAPRLLADAMLGRLARWLRILGYDTLYNQRWSDDELARRARAEGRILLTRDHALAYRPGMRTLLITSEQVRSQLAQVTGTLGPPDGSPWSRCPVCNEPLETVPHSWAWGHVPPYTFVSQREFRLCPNCSRFYWHGTHCEHMAQMMQT